jgi:hypothetical protein
MYYLTTLQSFLNLFKWISFRLTIAIEGDPKCISKEIKSKCKILTNKCPSLNLLSSYAYLPNLDSEEIIIWLINWLMSISLSNSKRHLNPSHSRLRTKPPRASTSGRHAMTFGLILMPSFPWKWDEAGHCCNNPQHRNIEG